MLANINSFWLHQYLKGRPAWSDRKVSFLLACYVHFIYHVWDFHILIKLWETALNQTQRLQKMASSCYMFCPV